MDFIQTSAGAANFVNKRARKRRTEEERGEDTPGRRQTAWNWELELESVFNGMYHAPGSERRGGKA